MKNKLFRKFWLCWEFIKSHNVYDEDKVVPLCPKDSCRCKMIKDNIYHGSILKSYWCRCINPECGFKLTLDTPLEEKWHLLSEIIEWQSYREFEIIDLDGELIPINERKKVIDGDYWVDARISENKRGEKQLMVLAWSKKNKDKTQLFLDSSKERFWFDQNDTHPSEVFSEVFAIFKNSQSKLSGKDE